MRRRIFTGWLLSIVIFTSACTNATIEGVDETVSLLSIPNIVAPAAGVSPVTDINSIQYTGTIVWSPAVTSAFSASTIYTATITLAPKYGYTFDGIEVNSFIVQGADTVSNTADSGVITAIFPETSSNPPSATFGTLTFATPSATELTVSFPGKNTGATDYAYEIWVSSDDVYTYEANGDKYAYYDANSDSYSHTFSALNPNTQYFVKVVYIDSWTGNPIEQYTTTTKTAIEYGYPLAPAVTIKKSETTKDSVRLNFTAPTKDNLGNDITVKKYIVTVDGVDYETTNAYFDLLRGTNNTFSAAQAQPDFESVTVRVVANESDVAGLYTTSDAYTKFSSAYEEWYYKLSCVATLTSDPVYGALATTADNKLTALQADSDHTDAHILANYTLTGDVYGAMTKYYSVPRSAVLRAYINDAADIDPASISTSSNIITALLMPNQTPKQKGIFENFDAYKNAELALMLPWLGKKEQEFA